MCRKSLDELLYLADDGCLENGEDLLLLQRYVDGCQRGFAVRCVIRKRCCRLAAPLQLRVRILQSLPHRSA